MNDPRDDRRGLPVPSGRLARLARFGGMAGGIAGRALAGAAREAVAGRRPELESLLLTPANARRVADELARLRGAAMKMGQLLSMDAGELLPPELADILARLREDAAPMPPRQLDATLQARWGRDWRRRFAQFDAAPLAAASIGQVHRATTRDGRELAVKIQYPGVRRSIDSDVDNVASLMRLAGFPPRHVDVAPLLAEAKRQLHEEADYAREADCLGRFHALLADAPDYVVPAPHGDLSTPEILAMDFAPGIAVERLRDAAQETRDRVARLIIALTLRELFEFGLMQTDPNFANYRFQPETGRLVLLDFGATRAIPAPLAEAYAALGRAGLAGDRAAMRAAMVGVGGFEPTAEPAHQDMVLDLAEALAAPVRAGGLFDFADPALIRALRERGVALAEARDFWHVPPADTLFVQRKLAGVYLLAARLRARLDVRALVAPWLERPAA